MSTDQRAKHAETVIRNHSVWSIASGAIPVAFADLAAVSAVQLDMIRQLCEVYDVDFSVKKGKAMVASITSAALARVGAASVVKLVPIAGSLVGSVSGGILAGASSYALGQAFKTHLATGGTFLDLDADRLKRIYREQFEKGKEVVKQWKQEAGSEEQQSSKFRWEDIVRRAKENIGMSEGETNTSGGPSSPKPKPNKESKSASTTSSSFTTEGDPSSISAKLEELAKLYERELISKADYEATKARLLEAL